MSFELPKLPYNFDSLEPHIDTKTMEIHYGKHHNGYTNNLNNIIVIMRITIQSSMKSFLFNKFFFDRKRKLYKAAAKKNRPANKPPSKKPKKS